MKLFTPYGNRQMLRLAAFALLVTSLTYGARVWQDRHTPPPTPVRVPVRIEIIETPGRVVPQGTDTYNLPAVTEASKRCPECSGAGGE